MVQDLIEHFTYAGLLLVLFATGLGLPIPEEGPILAAGVLSGDTALYWVGHHWGERILEWRAVRLVL
ncbi:MAG: DedA family protein [Candidatus Limnocylindria bacterium]